MGRWSDKANRYGYQLGALFNDNMREVLRVGIHTLVENTYMDSGRAAAHWIVVPNDKGARPGNRAQARFPNPDFGKGIVGEPGDKVTASGDELRVAKFVAHREMDKSISKYVKGRKPSTRFIFHSFVPQFWDDDKGAEGGLQDYHKTAALAEAKAAAESKMNIKFNSLMKRGIRRKRPLR